MEQPPRATIDFETRSATSLRKCGTWKYSIDPSTDILCLAFRLPYWEPDKVVLWHPPFPALNLIEPPVFDEVLELLEWVKSGGLVEAHNSWFEYCIWRNILTERYAWPLIPDKQWRCSAAKAAAHALPRALEKVATILQVDVQKDMDGTKTMKKMTKPRKSRKAEREYWVTVKEDEPDVLYHENLDLLERLFLYCTIDVLAEEAVSEALDDLSPEETQVYLLDQTINARGFQLDREAVDTALALIDSESRILNQQLTQVTGGKVKKATQRAQVKAWLLEQGVDLPDTQRTTVEGVLEYPHLVPYKACQGLQILKDLGRSSTAKYETMHAWQDPEGLVRGGLLYHGASTGRWSGAGVQPQNFVRGSVKDVEKLWQILKTLDRDVIAAEYGSVMEALANALRGAIVPRPGRQLYVADYASIEARVLFWLADDQDALDIFRRGEDIYCDMAGAIYDRIITKSDAEERQLGKAAVLGCFAADTLVLTPHGWIPLVEVTSQDYVWDGEEWTSHGGVVYNGYQEVLCLEGLLVTPGHLILCGNRWVRADEVAHNASEKFQALARGSEKLPWKDTCEESAEGSWESWLRAHVVLRGMWSPFTTSCMGGQRDAMLAPKSEPATPALKNSGGIQMCSLMLNTVHGYLTESVPSLGVVLTPVTKTTVTMAAEVFASILHGWKGTKKNEQTEKQKAESCFWPIFLHCRDGITLLWNWIGRIMIGGMNQAIYGSVHEESTYLINDKLVSSNNEFKTWRHVYDLVNAGPRHQFTVLTNQGPLLVHNCGYQMGGPKFMDTAKKYGVTITEDFSREVVAAYRNKYWRVKELWTEQEDAAVHAWQTQTSVVAGYTTWEPEDRFLYCQLPSGRRLAYPFPQVKQGTTPWGEPKWELTFKGVNAVTRQWQRQKTYGGMLVENVTQAVARDLMAAAMLRCERSGMYQLVLSVHDELVAEALQGRGSVKEFEALMAECPEWAEGCPVAAEGWTGTRYRK